MTAPKITWGHGFCEDSWATLTDDYTFNAGGSTGTYGVTASQNFYITLTAYVGDAYLVNNDNLSLSTTDYPYIMFRYKTASGAAKCKIVAEFSDATTQTVLAATASSVWVTAIVALTATKMLDHLKFYCAENTGTVNYDFALVYVGTFTFPQYTTVQWDMENRYSNTEIPSRLGRRKAWMGANEVLVAINGPIDHDRSSWKRGITDTNAAQVLEDIHHNAYAEPWQWLTTDRGAFKAVLEHLTFLEAGDQPFLYSFSAIFSEYRLGKAQTETWKERVKL